MGTTIGRGTGNRPYDVYDKAETVSKAQITGSTPLAGLNADLLDGLDSSRFASDGVSLPDGTDFNTVTKSGFYRINSNNINATPNSTGGQLIVSRNANTIVQMSFADYNTIDYYVRVGYGIGGTPTFTPWVKMWNSGNDGAGSGLDADTVDGVQGALLGIGGQGYAWVDETANRALGTTYTNTTGKPIQISWNTDTTTGASKMYINGIEVWYRYSNTGYSGASTEIIVPAGATYMISTGSTTRTWFELK